MKNLKKIVHTLLTSLMLIVLLVSCSSSPKGRKVERVYSKSSKKKTDKKVNIKKEKINLEYSAFKKFNLPLPIDNYGDKVDYLIPVNDNFDENFSLFKKYDEKRVLNFYKNTNISGYGDNSPYWRWKTSIKKSDWYDKVRKKVYEISRANYRNVFILEGKQWVQKRISKLSRVKDVKIIARGPSGIVTHILVVTSNNKYLVTKEWNVRKIFATHNDVYGSKSKNDYNMQRPVVKNVHSLPSAYLGFEEHGDYITVYGGGFGHGAGMCQYAVPHLVKDGYDYRDILKRYYYSAKLSTIEEVLGENKKILVGITSHGNLNHKALNIYSNAKLRIFNEDFDISVKPNEEVNVKNKWGKVLIATSNGEIFSSRHPVNFKSDGEFVAVGPIKKSHTSYPHYRDTIVISPYGNGLKVINSLDMDKYLMQVLPSEMPKSFGLEALKVQAVAARTYALSDYLKARYEEEGFHVKDTVESQVFNNQVENDEANQAIKETLGEIMIYDGKPVDAKYFSTSSGFTSFANDVW